MAYDLDIDDLDGPATGRDLLHLVQVYKLEQFMKQRSLDLLRQEVETNPPKVEAPADEVLLTNSVLTTEVPPAAEILKLREEEHRDYLCRVWLLMGLGNGTIENDDQTIASRSTLKKFMEAEESGKMTMTYGLRN